MKPQNENPRTVAAVPGVDAITYRDFGDYTTCGRLEVAGSGWGASERQAKRGDDDPHGDAEERPQLDREPQF